MSDQTEAPCDSSYRRFRSEYRGKRWLAQKILRDNHGRTKREQQRERSDSLCSQRELRRADLEMRRKAMREEKEEQKIARGAAKRAADDELEKEAFAYLAHPLKSLPGKDKQRREESLKRELKDMYTRKATSVKRSRQPNQLLKTLLKEAAEGSCRS